MSEQTLPINFSSQRERHAPVVAHTPPERTSNLLPTPPPSQQRTKPSSHLQVIDFLHTRQEQTHSRISAPRFKLTPQDFKQLVQELRDNQSLQHLNDKIRYAYDPTTEVLELSMPSVVHDYVSTAFAGLITDWIREIKTESGYTGEFAARIKNVGSASIFMQEITKDGVALERQPDAQFQHKDARFPGTLVEVMYSQNENDVDKRAWQYIQATEGAIKVVIGISINCSGKPSTLTVWRPDRFQEEGEELETLGVKRTTDCEEFRDAQGSSVNKEKFLSLTLSDFAPDDMCERLDHRTLDISYQQLADITNEAEEMQKVREIPGSYGTTSGSKFKKRKRPSSSDDEIKSEDESHFRKDEERVEERTATQDQDYTN